MFKFQDRPFFDPKGNWYIPQSIPLVEELTPRLKPSEWICWVLDNSLNTPKKFYKQLVGNPTTVWRLRKQLRSKGYETK